MQLTLHATRATLHGTSCLVQATSAWSVKTQRAPSRECKDARVYGHATTAMHGNEYTPSSQPDTYRQLGLFVDIPAISPQHILWQSCVFDFALRSSVFADLCSLTYWKRLHMGQIIDFLCRTLHDLDAAKQGLSLIHI